MDENEWTREEWLDRLEAEELAKLSDEQRAEVEIVIEVVKRTGQHHAAPNAHGDGDAYAYPRPDGGIAWGVNSPLNVARAIRRAN